MRRGEWRQRYQQRRSDERTLQQITFHESAHAAIAVLVGCRIERIDCGRGACGNGLSGAVHWNHASGDGRRIDPKTNIIVSLAASAVDRFLGYKLNYSSDLRYAREAAEQIGGDVEAILNAGQREAEALVAQHIPAIAALAGALMRAQHHELPGGEVERILAEAGVRRAASPEPAVGVRPRRERYYERRDGRTVAVARPSPGREAYVVQRRCDGYVA
jgi:hypothetical protein